jgi:16S rRNA (guanine1516-N2)-methyltransferase
VRQQVQLHDLALVPVDRDDEAAAQSLAQRLELPLLDTGSDPLHHTEVAAVLVVSGVSVTLQATGRGAPGPISVDFGSPAMRHRRRSGNNELLGKAVGLGKKCPLRILDTTAGLGRDSFVLADLGCEVMLCEREPVVLELLRSGMAVAKAEADPWLDGVIGRMRLSGGDAREMAATSLQDLDVIYLDPMFPLRSKSAAVKKEMALFQWLLDSAARPQDADALLLWAVQQDVARVVVKRPIRAPDLATRKPSHCIAGKAVRYDVYVHRKLL